MTEVKDLLNVLLEESQKKQLLLSIYDNRNDIDKLYVGYIVNLYDDSILIYSYNENGEGDGYLLIRLVDIYKIEKESDYLNSLNILVEQNTSTTRSQKNKFKDGVEEGLMEVASICHEQRILVTIKLIYEDFLMGYIAEKDDEYLLIEKYSKNGSRDGYNLIWFRDIQNIHFEGKEEKNIVKLLKVGVL